MYGWEQLHRVWLRAKQLLPSVVTHREGPGLDGPCIVFGEPSGHVGWTAPRRRSDALTRNLPLNGRRAKTTAEAYQIHFLFTNVRFSWTFPLVPCFPGECRAPAATSVGQSETTAPSRLSAALCLTPPISAQTSRSPAAGTHRNENDLTFKRMRKLWNANAEPELSFTFRTSRVRRIAAHWEHLCARRAALWKLMKLSGWDWS